MTFYDAHNHLHDPRLDPYREEVLRELPALGVAGAVVNGTSEADWQAVADLAAAHEWIVPSFGLHPWFVAQRSAHWRDDLQRRLDANSHAGIGEIGLDRWVKGHDLAVQSEVFEWQLALAAERDLPASIHCLKAWGALWDLIRERPVPRRGFLLHSFGGPLEMVGGFVERGAYFSFSPYFLHERKAAQREVFREVPRERLLVETDAPDMWPPDERNPHPLQDADGQPINHPANIQLACEALAETLAQPISQLLAQVAENYRRLFL